MFTPAEILQMLVWYSSPENGAGPEDWVSVVFGGVHSDYRAEKVRCAERGFLRFYAGLDIDNRAKLLDAMFKKYGESVSTAPRAEQ